MWRKEQNDIKTPSDFWIFVFTLTQSSFRPSRGVFCYRHPVSHEFHSICSRYSCGVDFEIRHIYSLISLSLCRAVTSLRYAFWCDYFVFICGELVCCCAELMDISSLICQVIARALSVHHHENLLCNVQSSSTIGVITNGTTVASECWGKALHILLFHGFALNIIRMRCTARAISVCEQFTSQFETRDSLFMCMSLLSPTLHTICEFVKAVLQLSYEIFVMDRVKFCFPLSVLGCFIVVVIVRWSVDAIQRILHVYTQFHEFHLRTIIISTKSSIVS